MHQAPAGPVVLRTRTADLVDPLGIDDPHPDLSWHLTSGRRGDRQIAYQVQAAGTAAGLAADRPDLWDTGRVADISQRVRYGGVPLRSRQRVHWRVRAWADDTAGPWSSPSHFELGLPDAGDFSAQWITHPRWASRLTDQEPDAALPLLAVDFTVADPIVSARLYATGVGVCVVTVNGRPVGDGVLEPPNTDYTQRVVYTTADVTTLVRPGANTVGIQLAPGIAHVRRLPGRYTKFEGTQALPAALVQLEMTGPDGTRTTVASDQDWRTTAGPTLISHWYGGEDYDARRELAGWDQPGHDRGAWQPVAVVQRPGVTLSARSCPPITVVEELPTVAVTRPAPGVQVFDLGTNIAGWPVLRADLPAGQEITLRPAEQLDADGRVLQDDATTGVPIFDTYLAKEGPQSWHPSFTYHGFRYLEVTGLPADAGPECVAGLVLRADNERIGEFHTSNPLLNAIHRIIDRAVQGNMYSVLTDCPHREKLGWLEETHLVFDGIARGYDVAAYYREQVRNMAEAQTGSGLVPDIAPEYVVFADRFRDDPNWGSAIIMVPWLLYREHGDLDTARRYFPAMLRYLRHLSRRATGDILAHGLGDWIAIDESTPLDLVATWGYHRTATTLAGLATALDEPGEGRRLTSLAQRIARAFQARFFDPSTTRYGSGSQACDALALDLGCVPEDLRQAVIDRLCAAIAAAGHHLTVGEIALPVVFRVLSAAGKHDLLYRLATQTTPPSYGHQVLAGATSLAEAWDGPTRGLSQNHFMLGAIESWFCRRLGGVDQHPGSVAYRHLLIEPAFPSGLDGARHRTRIPYGEVAVSWHRSADALTVEASIPVGATATVRLPAGMAPADEAAAPMTDHGSHTEFRVGSGRWIFTSASSRTHVEALS
jgi:hypothetical protein